MLNCKHTSYCDIYYGTVKEQLCFMIRIQCISRKKSLVSGSNSQVEMKPEPENNMEITMTQITGDSNQKRGINPYDVNETEIVQRDGERYDLDCLCQMYFDECQIAIKGGCHVSTHQSKTSVDQGVLRDVVSSQEGNNRNVCDAGETNDRKMTDINEENYKHEKEPQKMEQYEEKRSKQSYFVGAHGMSKEGAARQVNHQFIKQCHSCCEANNRHIVFAIEDCAAVTPHKKEILHHNLNQYSAEVIKSVCNDCLQKCNCQNNVEGVLYCELEHLNLSGCFQISDIGLG